MSRDQFDRYYDEAGLCCLAGVKEKHWQTWLKAQEVLLSAHGPVTMLTMDNVVTMPGLPDADSA